jgi:glutamate-ammonia-ligase adenylyltransferase
VGEAFEALRERILRRERDRQALKGEIRAMREKLHAAHPNRSGLFDLKHDDGGMIDVEFAVQFLVLAYAHRYPGLTGNLGNIALLRMAAEHGLLEKELAEGARNAYREFRRLQHALRLNGAQYARVPHAEVAAHVHTVQALTRALFAA